MNGWKNSGAGVMEEFRVQAPVIGAMAIVQGRGEASVQEDYINGGSASTWLTQTQEFTQTPLSGSGATMGFPFYRLFGIWPPTSRATFLAGKCQKPCFK